MSNYQIQGGARREQPTAVRRAMIDVTEIGNWLGATYHAVVTFLATHDLVPSGPPFARYHPVGQGRFRAEAGFPVAREIETDDDVSASVLPGGLVATTLHVGPYDAMEPAYQALASWVGEHGGETTGDAWEVYLSDPNDEPDPALWRTEVVQPYWATSTRN
jgi:effector-binding domain-containing protein